MESNSPLAGVRVIESTSIYSGPLAGLLLAELGADVVKVESQSKPDLIRHTGGRPYGVTPVFYALNRGKRFVSIDATNEAGRAVLLELIDSADVFLHNIRPGKPEALGLGYEVLAARNPRLVYAAISGLGRDGPDVDQRVYDFVVQARVGMVDYQRDAGTGRASLISQVVVDKSSGMAIVQAILAALYARERTGRGQRIDVPMLGVGLHFEWPDAMGPTMTQLEPPVAPDRLPPHMLQMPAAGILVLRGRDGGEIACSPSLPPFDGFAIALDRPDWLVDPRFAETETRIVHFPAFHAELVESAARFDGDALLARLHENGVPAGRVQRRLDVHRDPQVVHLDLLVERDSGHFGRVRQPRPMWQFSETPAVVTTSMGHTGQHTREVLREHGLSDAKIDALIAAGAIADAT
ncbi:MAG: CoA transferase [Deltaproteobacteria bacterium]|nr:CoA transferase [Deltaproteobacteria bacterium]